MDKYVFFIIVWFLSLPLTAQKPAQIEFVETAYDLGTFSEDGGARCHEFVFTNKGEKPLLVYEVTTTCGCTVPDFSREPVLPGRQGKIVLTYHPKGHPGSFTRKAMVKINAGLPETVLSVTGRVIPGVEEKYPGYRAEIGNLKLKTCIVRLGTLYKDRPYEQRVVVINKGLEPLAVNFEEVPPHLSVRLEPDVLRPGQEGEIVIDYRTPFCADWGMREDSFYIRPSGYTLPSGDANKFSIYADLCENTANWPSERKKNAPEVFVYPHVLHLSREAKNGVLKYTLRVSNKGQSDLLLRKIYCPSPEVSVVLPAKKIIPPQQAVEIIVLIDTGKSSGFFPRTELYICTNDPNRQSVKIPVAVTGE